VTNKSDYQSKPSLYHTQSRDIIKDSSLTSYSINSNVLIGQFHLLPTAELTERIQRNLLGILANIQYITATDIKATWKCCGRISVCDRNLILNLCFLNTSNAHSEMRFTTATGQKMIWSSAHNRGISKLGNSQPSV
jgi:hypothetical protein